MQAESGHAQKLLVVMLEKPDTVVVVAWHRRSGWQPPKDTGLWDAAVRISQAIQDQMTPTQQEYWQGENGYFSQVYRYQTGADNSTCTLQTAVATGLLPRDGFYRQALSCDVCLIRFYFLGNWRQVNFALQGG